ncbi:cytochrome C [bacterium]|nr:cytochrome C [bacterium]
MKKKFKIIALSLLGLLIVIQFFRIDKTNPDTVVENQFTVVENPPAEVADIMQRACYDCHSNETKYPWYTNVAPVSWIIKNHINEGRHEMNFSEWGTYTNSRRHHKLEECLEEVAKGEMPLRGYVVWHDEALLTPQDTAILFPFWRKAMHSYAE